MKNIEIENPLDNHKKEAKQVNLRVIFGACAIIIGILTLVAQEIRIGWVAFTSIPLVGLYLIITGFRNRKSILLFIGSFILPPGTGYFLIQASAYHLDIYYAIVAVIISLSTSWLIISIYFNYLRRKRIDWMITVSLTIIIVSSPLLIREFIWTKYLLITITGTGLFYIIYGLIRKLFGLIIAGSLLASIGPGISLSWGGANTINGLSNTGAMLVWFALGWFFIVIFYKLRYGGFIWWPLIPGCVLAITGWGLYIGGSPDRAVGVIGNSGSIGLILIGIYLLLIKNGMNN